jgi:hypothetical protein
MGGSGGVVSFVGDCECFRGDVYIEMAVFRKTNGHSAVYWSIRQKVTSRRVRPVVSN